jgi:hypothetical protein
MPGVEEESAFVGGVFRQWFLNWFCHERLLVPSCASRLPCLSFNWHPFYFVKYSYCVSSISYFFTLQSTSAVPSLIIMLGKRQKFWRILLRDFLRPSVKPSFPFSHINSPSTVCSFVSSVSVHPLQRISHVNLKRNTVLSVPVSAFISTFWTEISAVLKMCYSVGCFVLRLTADAYCEILNHAIPHREFPWRISSILHSNS